MTVTLKPNRLEQFSDLVHLIYAASAEPSRWPDAVAAVAQSMQAQRTLLFTPFVGPAHGGLLFPWQIEEKHLALWGSKYIDHDVRAQNAQRKGVGKRGCADGRRVDARGRIPRLCVLPRVFEPDRHRPLVCGRRLWRLARPAGDLLACCLPIVLASRFWPAATGCTMTRRARGADAGGSRCG